MRFMDLLFLIAELESNRWWESFLCLSASLYQAVGVVTHVPEGDEGQSDPAAVHRGDLVLTGHHRGDGPPVGESPSSSTTHIKGIIIYIFTALKTPETNT